MDNLLHKATRRKSNVLTLGELAAKTHAILRGSPEVEIHGVGSIWNASSGEITFLAESKYTSYLSSTQASAVILTEKNLKMCGVSALVCADPKLVFAQIIDLLHPFQQIEPFRHSSAVIGDACEIHQNTVIGPHCVIGNRVKIAANVVIEAGCFVGDDCEIGEGTVLFPHVTLNYGTSVGSDCTIHSGTVIGSDGFGFAKNKERWIKVPQIGSVKIGSRVEIGANTTIDRGALEDTEIGNDVILDNLIQIGHNVKIGDGTAIAACCGIAGSAVIGKHCMIGGGTGVVGHICVADYVMVVPGSNIGQSIKKPGIYASGLTTTDMKTWKRNLVRHHQLDNLANRLINIERKLKAQEET